VNGRAQYREAVEEGVRALARADPLMRRLIRRHGCCALAPDWRRTPYEALVRAVIHQQLAGAAARTIHGRFLALFPGVRFPAPASVLAATDEALRSAGLSRQKAAYIRDIAARAASGEVPLRRGALSKLSDDEIVARLTEARGVGRWTVEMLLMFTLGRLDVLPVDDYGVRSGYAKAAGVERIAPEALREIGLRWAPYRSIAAWYCWRAADA
jgi:DNA-3-methyladenine glycosylase II